MLGQLPSLVSFSFICTNWIHWVNRDVTDTAIAHLPKTICKLSKNYQQRLFNSTITTAMNLRPATAADLDLLRHWDEQPHVIASDPNDDWHWEIELDRTPDWREQLIAEINGRAIGFIQIIDPASQTTCPNSARLMNKPITMSCSHSDLEKQIVLQANRLIRVRKVKCLRSIFCVFHVPTTC